MADITTAALSMFAITEITGKNAQSLLNARAGFAPAPVRWLIPIINARILTFTKAAFAIEIRLKQDKRNSGNFSRCFFCVLSFFTKITENNGMRRSLKQKRGMKIGASISLFILTQANI